MHLLSCLVLISLSLPGTRQAVTERAKETKENEANKSKEEDSFRSAYELRLMRQNTYCMRFNLTCFL